MDKNQFQNVVTEETFHDGQVIFKEGSSGDWIYVIMTGSIEISKQVGGENRIIEILGPGEVFGELGFIGNIKRTATAKAVGLTTIGIIDRAFLDTEFNKMSNQFRIILMAVIHRFRKMLERASDFTSRNEPRAAKTLSLTYKSRESSINAYSGDISAGGLSIRTENPLPKGNRFNLKIQVPGRQDPIPVTAEVMWSRERGDKSSGKPAGMGVRFCEITEQDHQFIKKYVNEILAKR